MKLTIDKCEQCGELFEKEKEYSRHMKIHEALNGFAKRWPSVKDSGCSFANGEYHKQRDEKWFNAYKEDAINTIKKFHPSIVKDRAHWTYGFYRCLDDGDSMFYGISCRTLNICPTCFKEWGQPYYANKCCKTSLQP